MILCPDYSNVFSLKPSRNTDHELGKHIRLARFNEKRLRPSVPEYGWEEEIEAEVELKLLEGQFLEEERRSVSRRAMRAPWEAKAFIEWFKELKQCGPGQNDPLFRWLAEEADLNQMSWFLTQEVGGEAGFDDLVAMTQVKFPTQAKLELARNYWDEMGRGNEDGMHGPMLEKVVHALGLKPSMEKTVWESLALANLMAGLASNRRYAYHSIGALGAVELTAPSRVSLINEGLKRLNVAPEARQYFALHAQLDIRHSEAWNLEVILPLIRENPENALAIAEGALMRLKAGERCFERYRREFDIH